MSVVSADVDVRRKTTVLTAQLKKTSADSLPEFAEWDANYLCPVSPSDLFITAAPKVYNPYFHILLSNVAALSLAISTGKPIAVTVAYANMRKWDKFQLDLDHPQFGFAVSVKSEESLKAKIGTLPKDFTRSLAGDMVWYTAKNKSENVAAVAKKVSTRMTAPKDTLNIAGAITYSILQKMIGIWMDLLIANWGSPDKAFPSAKESILMAGKGYLNSSPTVHHLGRSKKTETDCKIPAWKTDNKFMVAYTLGEETEMFMPPITDNFSRTGRIGDPVTFTYFGNDRGLVFPYFDGLLLPDPLYIQNFLTRRCLNLLGDSIDECYKSLKVVLEGVNSVAKSKAGRALTHMIIGIELAIQAQGDLLISIIEQQYLGFAIRVLPGQDFAVHTGHGRFDSRTLSKSSFLETLGSKLGPIERLCAFLSMVPLLGGDLDPINWKGLTPYKLAVALGARKYTEEQKKIVDKMMVKVWTSQKYWEPTQERLLDMLKHLLGISPYTDGIPMAITGDPTNYADPYFFALAPFGHTAPSFQGFPSKKAKEFTLPSSSLVGGQYYGKPDVNPLFPFLPVYNKALKTAAVDMKNLCTTGRVRYSLTKNKGASDSSRIFDGKDTPALYDRLLQAKAMLGKSPVVESAAKRKRSVSVGLGDDVDVSSFY